VYGYFPMSEHLVVSPERVDGRGFFDGAAHRRPMASAYNHYLRTDADASYDPDREAQQMLLRPLFFTSYLVDDLLVDNEDFGASTILLSSASSKTAIGTAFQLRARSGIEVVGLTSAGNCAFVEELDLYDRVLSYDEVGELATTPSAYVDVAGIGPLREAIHAHLGDALTHDMIVGATHWDEGGGGGDLPGPTPTMFFAPSQVAKRAKEWGQAGFDERLGTAWTSFSTWTDRWLEVRRGAGPEAVEDAYRTVLQGGLDPRVGNVVSMGAGSVVPARERPRTEEAGRTRGTVRYGQVDRDYGRTLATTPPDEDGPVWMVNLMKYRDTALYDDGRADEISGREADDRYSPTTSLGAIGARIVFVADVERQLLGDEPTWDRIAVVRYPTRRSFIEMQSRPDFVEKHVHKEAGMDQTIVIGTQPLAAPAAPPDAPDWADVPHPPTDEDGPVVIMHVLRFHEGGADHDMVSYQEAAGRVAVPHGVRIAGWFRAEGTIVGDGRAWDQVRFNQFPSMAAFMAVALDPARFEAQREHREVAIADTYTLVLRPTLDELAASTIW